jgi:hypothetical protein
MNIVECVVHTIKMGDVEDPDLYIAHPIYEWQKTEAGQWVMDNAVDVPMWNRTSDQFNYGHVYTITAKLKAIDHTYFKLKFQ